MQTLSKIKNISKKKEIRIQYTGNDRAKFVIQRSFWLSRNPLINFDDEKDLYNIFTSNVYMDSERQLRTNLSIATSSHLPTHEYWGRLTPIPTIDHGKKKPGWVQHLHRNSDQSTDWETHGEVGREAAVKHIWNISLISMRIELRKITNMRNKAFRKICKINDNNQYWSIILLLTTTIIFLDSS